MLLAVSAFLAGFVGTARASYPYDVVLRQRDAYEGEKGTDTKAVMEGYEEVVKELGVAIANKPMAPGETLGINGFDLSVYNSVAFIHAKGTDDEPSGWERTHTD